MMPWLGLMLDTMTIFVLAAYALSVLAAVVPVVGSTQDRAQELRRRLLWAPLGAAGVVLLGFCPSLLAAWTGEQDHCMATGFAHPHLCWFHSRSIPDSHHDLAVVLVLSLVLLAALWQTLHWAFALGRLKLVMAATLPQQADEVRQLLSEAGQAWPWGITVVNVGLPMCFVRGIWRPRLVISTAVLNAFSPDELRLVVAHEAAHIARQDNLWRVLGRFLVLSHLPGLGQRTYDRWVAAAEAACDERAAEAAESRVLVAEALVRYQRLVNQQLHSALWGAAFGDGQALKDRVTLLLDPPPTTAWRFVQPAWPWLTAFLLALQVDHLHNALENLLGLLHL